jgi:hypothetical protein
MIFHLDQVWTLRYIRSGNFLVNLYRSHAGKGCLCIRLCLKQKFRIYYIIMRRSDSQRGFGLEMGFIYQFNIQLVTAFNHSTIADLHTLSFFSLLSLAFPGNGSYSGDSSTALTKSSVHRLPYNSEFLLQLTSSKPLGTDQQKTPFTVVLPSFPWEHVCFWGSHPVMAAYTCLLKICCPAVNVVSWVVLRSLPSNGSTHYTWQYL